MDVNKQLITEQYALYHGDSNAGMEKLPPESIDFSIYSPPLS